MSLPFKQINLNFSEFDFLSIIDKDFHYKNKTETFYQYHILENNEFVNFLNKKVLFKIKPDKVNVTKIIYPGMGIHTDSWKTALNYFITSNDTDITTFYTDPVIKTKFDAHSCYLLNTHCPHSVEVNDPTSERFMLRFMWFGLDLKEVEESIILL